MNNQEKWEHHWKTSPHRHQVAAFLIDGKPAGCIWPGDPAVYSQSPFSGRTVEIIEVGEDATPLSVNEALKVWRKSLTS